MSTMDNRNDLETWWSPAHDVAVRMGGGGICFSGLFRCKSRHGCFHCSRRVALNSAAQMMDVCQKFIADNPDGCVAFLTATIRHGYWNTLDDGIDAVIKAWRSLRMGRLVKRLDNAGWRGYMRAVDVTWGADNGWHPHIHAIVLLSERPSPGDLSDLENEMWSRWNRTVTRMGFPGGARQRFQLEIARSSERVAGYCAKASGHDSYGRIAHELRLDKVSKKGATPAALYVRAANGDRAALDAVWQFEGATHRRKLLTYSKLAAGYRDPAITSGDQEENASSEPASFYLPTWLYQRMRDLPGAVDIFEAVLSIGRTDRVQQDYAGRNVWEYERGSPAWVAHVWMFATWQRCSDRVPAHAWDLAVDFIAVLGTELSDLVSPFGWWAGQNYDKIGGV